MWEDEDCQLPLHQDDVCEMPLLLATLDLESNMIVNIFYAHMHTSNTLWETAHKEEQKMIEAPSIMGRVSTVEILSNLKKNLERLAHPEAASSIRSQGPWTRRSVWEEEDHGPQCNYHQSLWSRWKKIFGTCSLSLPLVVSSCSSVTLWMISRRS